MLRSKTRDMAGLQAENAHKKPGEGGDVAGQRSLGSWSDADRSADRRAAMAGHTLSSRSVAKGKAGGSVDLSLLLNTDMAGHFVASLQATILC